MTTNVTHPDTDAADLHKRQAAIIAELAALVEEALRVRDQHAARVDAMALELRWYRASAPMFGPVAPG